MRVQKVHRSSGYEVALLDDREYAPRLRSRRLRELELIEDAISQGWDREVERHRCTAKRIEQLLEELNEPLEMIGEMNQQG